MDDRLRELRALGLPLSDCAAALGVGYDTVLLHAHRLGLAQAMNRGALRGRDLIGRPVDPALLAPLSAADRAALDAVAAEIAILQHRLEVLANALDRILRREPADE